MHVCLSHAHPSSPANLLRSTNGQGGMPRRARPVARRLAWSHPNKKARRTAENGFLTLESHASLCTLGRARSQRRGDSDTKQRVEIEKKT